MTSALPLSTPLILFLFLFKAISSISFKKVWIRSCLFGVIPVSIIDKSAYGAIPTPKVMISALESFAFLISPEVVSPMSVFKILILV